MTRFHGQSSSSDEISPSVNDGIRSLFTGKRRVLDLSRVEGTCRSAEAHPRRLRFRV